MNHIKTFEQYNITDGEIISEGMFKDLKTKINEFLNNPVDEEIANKLIQKSFVKQFNAKPTQAYEKLVLSLSLEEKIKLLKDIAEKLEYSSPDALRLVKGRFSDKLSVGSITRKNPTKSPELVESE